MKAPGQVWLKLVAAAYASFLLLIVALADLETAASLFTFARSLPGGDKSAHFLLLFLLSCLLNLAFGKDGRTAARLTLILAALVTLEESTQLFLPSRSAELLDLLANYAGILAGALAARALCSRPL